MVAKPRGPKPSTSRAGIFPEIDRVCSSPQPGPFVFFAAGGAPLGLGPLSIRPDDETPASELWFATQMFAGRPGPGPISRTTTMNDRLRDLPEPALDSTILSMLVNVAHDSPAIAQAQDRFVRYYGPPLTGYLVRSLSVPLDQASDVLHDSVSYTHLTLPTNREV